MLLLLALSFSFLDGSFGCFSVNVSYAGCFQENWLPFKKKKIKYNATRIPDVYKSGILPLYGILREHHCVFNTHNDKPKISY